MATSTTHATARGHAAGPRLAVSANRKARHGYGISDLTWKDWEELIVEGVAHSFLALGKWVSQVGEVMLQKKTSRQKRKSGPREIAHSRG